MHKTKHSKFKNTGILFELLTRQLTADILSGKDDSFARELIFKYFKESKELGKEWKLYKFIINEQFSDESKADRALDVVLKARERLNSKKLTEEKYNLIKEIKEKYSIDEFLKSNIKNYKIFASIYKVFENHINGNNFKLNEVIEAKSLLIDNLTSSKKEIVQKKDSLLEYYESQPKEIKMLAFKFLVDSLNKKYKEFDDRQKQILKEYINNLSDATDLKKFVLNEKLVIKKELSSLVEKIDNTVTKIKVSELIHQLDSLDNFKKIRENHLVVLLTGYELIKEIKKLI